VFKTGHFTIEGDCAWIQIGFDELWRLESLINMHSNGVVLTQQVMSDIDTHGVRIGHPPIHIHVTIDRRGDAFVVLQSIKS